MEDMESVGDTGMVMENGGLRDLNVTWILPGANQQEGNCQVLRSAMTVGTFEIRLTGLRHILPFQLRGTGNFNLDNHVQVNGREVSGGLIVDT
jgi:hypothetical protein